MDKQQMPISNHWPAKVNSSKENIAVRGPFTKYKVEHNTGTDREEIRFFGRRLNVAQRPRELAMYKTHGPWPLMRQCYAWSDSTTPLRKGKHFLGADLGETHLTCQEIGEITCEKGGNKTWAEYTWFDIQFNSLREFTVPTVSQKHLKNSIPIWSNQ